MLDVDFLAEHFDIGRGIRPRLAEIEDAILEAWQQIIRCDNTLPEHVGWWGHFSSQGAPLLARYVDMLFVPADKQDLSGHVRLSFVDTLGIPQFSAFSWVPIRVVGSQGKQRMVDPIFPSDEAPTWRLWIWEGRPLSQLYWDPGEW